MLYPAEMVITLKVNLSKSVGAYRQTAERQIFGGKLISRADFLCFSISLGYWYHGIPPFYSSIICSDILSEGLSMVRLRLRRYCGLVLGRQS